MRIFYTNINFMYASINILTVYNSINKQYHQVH